MPEIEAITMPGQKLPSILYSPFDVYVSLLGGGVWGNRGYQPRCARQIAANVILYADWAAKQSRPTFKPTSLPATQPATSPAP